MRPVRHMVAGRVPTETYPPTSGEMLAHFLISRGKTGQVLAKKRSLSCRLFDLGLAQKPGGLFRRRRVDVEPGSPLEACNLSQLRNDFDVPVIMIVDLFPDGRSVNHEIERRSVEHGVHAHKGVL